MNDNHISTIPEKIGSTLDLRLLDLRNNQISSLPSTITEFRGVITIKLSGNPIDIVKLKETIHKDNKYLRLS